MLSHGPDERNEKGKGDLVAAAAAAAAAFCPIEKSFASSSPWLPSFHISSAVSKCQTPDKPVMEVNL